VQGSTDIGIAEALGVEVSTLYRWKAATRSFARPRRLAKTRRTIISLSAASPNCMSAALAYDSIMGKIFTFRADPDLAAILRDEASANGVSVSRLVRDACRVRLHLVSADIDRRQFNRFPTANSSEVAR